MNEGADEKWTAIVLAGQRPGENHFAASHGVAAKALIPVGGEPMLGRVARTLLACPEVARIVILAQEPQSLLQEELGWLGADPKVATACSGDGISTSIAAVAGSAEAPWPVLITTADHALLTPAIVAQFLAGTDSADAAVGMVERRVVEARYPETRRTWIKLRGGQYSGANLFALTGPEAGKALALWSEVEQDRKKALRLLSYFGPMLAIRALTRTIGLDGALKIAAKRMGIGLKAVRLTIAEAAIDVDKQEDLVLVERILSGA